MYCANIESCINTITYIINRKDERLLKERFYCPGMGFIVMKKVSKLGQTLVY